MALTAAMHSYCNLFPSAAFSAAIRSLFLSGLLRGNYYFLLQSLQQQLFLNGSLSSNAILL
jgi:hypothetical protein